MALRGGNMLAIGDLTEALGVTATAVRQRIDRLLASGLVERHKEVTGRGRPSYRYQLTVLGHQRAGANPGELADAMWREIVGIEDETLRERLVNGVASRLGKQFASRVQETTNGTAAFNEMTFSQRMQKLSTVMSEQEIETDVRVVDRGQLPILDITSCPYPTLTAASENRSMCKLEEQMISEALGQRVQLSSCRLDGDDCCQFSAVGEADSDSATSTRLKLDTGDSAQQDNTRISTSPN